VSFTVPASWTWWPETEEHHKYSYKVSDELASEQLQKQMEELHEAFSQRISDELRDTVFERTWKIVQEQIGKGSLQGLKDRVWSHDTHTHTHTHCTGHNFLGPTVTRVLGFFDWQHNPQFFFSYFLLL